jgi:hypothetical protein
VCDSLYVLCCHGLWPTFHWIYWRILISCSLLLSWSSLSHLYTGKFKKIRQILWYQELCSDFDVRGSWVTYGTHQPPHCNPCHLSIVVRFNIVCCTNCRQSFTYVRILFCKPLHVSACICQNLTVYLPEDMYKKNYLLICCMCVNPVFTEMLSKGQLL